MTKNRMEAFSDGIIAIIITIMVLELRPPHYSDWASLRSLVSAAVCYSLSFVFLGIYRVNHHHLLQAVQKVNGPILWANIHLLFWLSLVPFGTAWIGENIFAALPVSLYGVILFFAGTAYYILVRTLITHH